MMGTQALTCPRNRGNLTLKTLAEIDAILRDALSKARGAHKAETLDAARQHAAGVGTLIRKARAALAEVVAAAKSDDVAKG